MKFREAQRAYTQACVLLSQVRLVVVRVRARAIADMPGIMIGARCSVSKVRCKGTVR